jgi:Flp pilus assembly secretin CpaC
MRFLWLGWIMAIPCGAILGQDYNSAPVTAPSAVQPSAVYCGSSSQGSCSGPAQAPSVPSHDKLEHLLRAAAHLEAAGLPEDATKIWQQADQESKAVKKEMESLRAEVARLRRTIKDTHAVLIHLQAIEIARGKLRRLGFDFAKVCGGAPHSCVGVVERGNALFPLLDALRQDSLLKILAQPILVTESGHMASFRSGGEIPVSVERDGKTAVNFSAYGTEINVLPVIRPNGAIRIELTARFSELDLRQKVHAQNVTIPAVTCREISTGAELRSGQTFVLSGLLGRREQVTKGGSDKVDSGNAALDEIELWVLLTAETVKEGVDASGISTMPHQ